MDQFMTFRKRVYKLSQVFNIHLDYLFFLVKYTGSLYKEIQLSPKVVQTKVRNI